MMSLKFLVSLSLTLGASSLKLPSHEDRSCGLPEDLFWGVYIDGKDAVNGSEAYAWDSDFATLPMNTVHFLHDGTTVGENSELTPDVAHKLHDTCCKMFGQRAQGIGNTLNCIPSIEKCEMRMAGAKGINKDYIKFSGTPDENGCYKSYTRSNPMPVEEHMTKLFEKYNEKMRQSTNNDEKIACLANFMRNFAWLHPYKGGNGRMRNFLLQREIRRLGLGCGAMMYNNNRDIFFETDDRYAEKIREGIAMYTESASTKKNAWQTESNVNRHLEKFALDPQMKEVCVMKREKLGNIYARLPASIRHVDDDEE